MGLSYVEELNKSRLRESALNIIKNCSYEQLSNKEFNSERELAIAEVAKTWTDIYTKLGIKEVKL